jgi:hypothetical protein
LILNTTGNTNIAVGNSALGSNSSGTGNTVVGNTAASDNSTGSNNTVVGNGASTGNFSRSVILGFGATATNDNQFSVGSVSTNAGSVTSEVNTSSNVWNVVINGVAERILLA